jgi:hypothetical protein
MNEANVSVTDENILAASLAEFAGTVEPDALQEFKETARRIMRGEFIWTFAQAQKDFKDLAEEKPLDLSEVPTPKENECIDLAKSLSFALNHPNLPKSVYDAIHQELGMMNQPEKIIDSVEYIAQVLCENK